MLPASGTDIRRGIFVVFWLAWSGRVPRAGGKRPNESLPSSDTTKLLHPGRFNSFCGWDAQAPALPKTSLDRENSTSSCSVKKQNRKGAQKRERTQRFVWLKILHFSPLFLNKDLFLSWSFAALQACLDWRCLSHLWDAVGRQKMMEIGPVLKDTPWLHKHLTAAEQEVLLCWTFCLSFIFPFHKYRLETSPWKAEGNLVDCKHGGEEGLFRMVERV